VFTLRKLSRTGMATGRRRGIADETTLKVIAQIAPYRF
jgi:hypothetical protein